MAAKRLVRKFTEVVAEVERQLKAHYNVTQKELDALKEELPNGKWQAQYQQNPTSETSAIVKREWWQVWEKDDPPGL